MGMVDAGGVIEFLGWLAMYLPVLLAEWANRCPYLVDLGQANMENVFLGGEGLIGVVAMLLCYRCLKNRKSKPVEVKPEEK